MSVSQEFTIYLLSSLNGLITAISIIIKSDIAITTEDTVINLFFFLLLDVVFMLFTLSYIIYVLIIIDVLIDYNTIFYFL
ncbi:hypothetical protein MRGR3_1178 [Staphylococcus aureus subsp. aureus MRGR3]|nr:hypothetical protein MRGR3_1178 [Staphylococcus aureus subsp. aureus MRGR3]